MNGLIWLLVYSKSSESNIAFLVGSKWKLFGQLLQLLLEIFGATTETVIYMDTNDNFSFSSLRVGQDKSTWVKRTWHKM